MTIFNYALPNVFNSVNLTPSSGGFFSANGSFVNSTSTLTQYTLNTGLSQAFKMWSNSVNVSYVAGNAITNQLNIANWNTSETGRGSGTTYGVGSNFNAASNFWVFLNKSFDVIDPNGPADNMISNPTFQNWGVWNLAHELGHTMLGDSHPIATNDLRMSIMAYPTSVNSLVGSLGNNIILPNADAKIPLTPGMTDISFLQNGATNPLNGKVIAPLGVSTASSGTDTYSFTDSSINFTASTATASQGGVLNVVGSPSKYVMTIWDGGGADTINATGMTTSNYINLNAGQFSSIGSNIKLTPTGAIGSTGYGVDYNVGIAIGASIENATGGSAADRIVGNQLNNVLIGGGGNDTISGGFGNDTYTGGTGADAFVFDLFSPVVTSIFGTITYISNDLITDFLRAQGDKIDLSIIDANTNAAGNQALSFIGSQGFGGAFGLGVAGQLHFETGAFGAATNVLSGDTNGDLTPDFRITLTGITSLLASDFIL